MKTNNIKRWIFQTLSLCILLSFSFSGMARIHCEDENDVDRKRQEEPNHHLLLTMKANCLLLRGKKDEAFRYLIKGKDQKGVYPAYLAARYIESDGTFQVIDDPVRRSEILDVAIASYKEVADLMASIPDYPDADTTDGSTVLYALIEKDYLFLVRPFYRIARLYFDRYWLQVADHLGQMERSMPGYEEGMGKGGGLVFPAVRHFQGPTYSLNILDEVATHCSNIEITWVWKNTLQAREAMRENCNLYKNFATEIRDLENERANNAQNCENFLKLEGEFCENYWNAIFEIQKKRKVIIEHVSNSPTQPFVM